MPKILSALQNHLREIGLTFRETGEPAVLETTFDAETCTYKLCAVAVEEQGRVIFYAVCPVKAPPKLRHNVAEFITRANSGLMIGNLEMNFENGEVRYKTSIDVTAQELKREVIEPLLMTGVTCMDFFMPKLMLILYAGLGAADAIAPLKSLSQGGSGDENSRWDCN